MKKILNLLMTAIASVSMTAQNSQDFASKFMQQCDEDTAVQCITVSPKMMEKLTKQADANHNESMAQAIQKLKSARIVTASVHGDEYYRKAEELLEKNRSGSAGTRISATAAPTARSTSARPEAATPSN